MNAPHEQIPPMDQEPRMPQPLPEWTPTIAELPTEIMSVLQLQKLGSTGLTADIPGKSEVVGRHSPGRGNYMGQRRFYGPDNEGKRKYAYSELPAAQQGAELAAMLARTPAPEAALPSPLEQAEPTRAILSPKPEQAAPEKPKFELRPPTEEESGPRSWPELIKRMEESGIEVDDGPQPQTASPRPASPPAEKPRARRPRTPADDVEDFSEISWLHQ
jgi:hypothetical protein